MMQTESIEVLNVLEDSARQNELERGVYRLSLTEDDAQLVGDFLRSGDQQGRNICCCKERIMEEKNSCDLVHFWGREQADLSDQLSGHRTWSSSKSMEL